MGNFADMFTGIAGGLVGMDQDRQAGEAINRLPDTPGFSQKGYGEVSYLGDFNPALYGTPEAAQYQTVAEDPRVRDYQMQALARMQNFADQAAGSQEALGRYNAVSDANAVAAQQNAGIRNQMAMRGQGGAGMEFVLQQQAAQNAANRAQAAGLGSAQQAALQRLMGTQAAMQGAGALRGQDFNAAATNADIINRFNMANTQMRNGVNMANTDMRNQTGMRNLNTRQGLAGVNTGIRNSSLDRGDRNALTNMNSTRQKYGMQRDVSNSYTQNAGKFAGGMGSFVDATADMMSGGIG